MGILKYKNANVHYTAQGKGRVVVLLHGFLENSSMWNDVIADLSLRYSVISIDLLGHGKSDSIGYIHSMEDQAMMVKAVLDSLNLRRYVLIGHSMGSYIGLAFAALFSENLKGLCLMNSSPLADSSEKKINRDRAVEAVKQNHKTFIRMAIPNLFASYNLTKYKDEVAVVIEEALKMQSQGIIASLEGMKLRRNRTEILKKLTIPTQLIMGQNDGAIDFNATLECVKNTATEVVIFPDGHMSHLENKLELITTLHRFVNKCYQ